ncbi:hypothetical protein [Noviherbaspirillum sp.]|jgi:hypothetical protein|uniref:hypothetical protein n=1 Tax=Noviherbaspirillum sp. TaxID=1926288 RepID=UPI0025DEDF35|nr:hypothetical protein [Noviherbaspirillum sp.]
MKPFLFAISLGAGLLASASACAEWQYSAGGGLRYVRMTESDNSGRQLVREHGWLPGLSLNATQRRDAWSIGVSGEIYGADLNYDGRLQNGVPFWTDTATTQGRIATELSRQLNENTAVVGGLEYDEWRRHVLGRGTVAGVNERYSSWRLLAGVATTAIRMPAASFTFKGLMIFARPERLRVHFENQLYDDVRFSTKPAIGLRLGMTAFPRALPNLSFGLDLDWMRIRRSDDGTLYKDGIPTGTVAQPEHQRSALGFHADYRF